MNALLVGGGGREHAIAQKLRASERLGEFYSTDSVNPGIASLAQHIGFEFDVRSAYRLKQFCDAKGVNLVVIGPEEPIASGLGDELAAPGRSIAAPSKGAAQLESDKAWAKQLMRAASIPTAEAHVFGDPSAARAYLESRETAQVVKAAGLAKGKGVVVGDSMEEALAAVERMMVERVFGEAGARVVIEERLEGPEVSVLALVDGRTIYTLETAQDHKRLLEGDLGPNTGGMGAYSPAAFVDDEMMGSIEREILVPTIDALRREGIEYRGVLYAGLMLTPAGPKVLEFNVRFGDPECQALLPRLRGDFAELLYRTGAGTLAEADLSWDTRVSCCVVLASRGYPAQPETGFEIAGVDEAGAMEDVFITYAGVRRDADGALVTAGGRVISVTALGETLSDAREKALAACDVIQFDGKQLRRDIGKRPEAIGARASTGAG